MDANQIKNVVEKIKDQVTNAGRCIVAIDGNSASGKSTLASLLATTFDCNLFHMDDYFLTPSQRTMERLNEIGGNFDRERFLLEVLLPISKNQTIQTKRYDCKTNRFCPMQTYPQKDVTIIEGCYSTHPALLPYYTLTIFLSISPNTQRERIISRNPALAESFFSKWIPLENKFFVQNESKNKCDLIIVND